MEVRAGTPVGQELQQGRNLEADTEADHGRSQLVPLLLLVCLFEFRVAHRTTCPGIASPRVSRALLHQSVTEKMPPQTSLRSDGGISSTEVHFTDKYSSCQEDTHTNLTLDIFYFKFFFLNYLVVPVPHAHTCVSLRITCRSWFSHYNIWIQGLGLRLPG